MVRGFFVAAGLLWLGSALPAQAQSAPTETWLGCPAGHALETAPDPRILPAAATLQPAAPRLVVRCVARSITELPVCPSGLRVVPTLGTDRCTAPRSSGSPTMGDGSVRFVGGTTDGTSNTVMVGEATAAPPPPPPSGAGLTTGKGTGTITAAPAVPACIIPRRLVVDPGGSATDTCELTTVALPADRVSLPAR